MSDVERRCRWWQHRWSTVDFIGLAALSVVQRCSRCGKTRTVEVTP